MNVNTDAVLAFAWTIIALWSIGLIGLWIWVRRMDREFREDVERIRADRG